MLKKLSISMMSLLSLLLFTQCIDDDSETEIMQLSYNNLAVTSFSLSRNDSVCFYLDSVYFAVDLTNGRIYNPDSLPKGTVPKGILIKPVYGEVSKAEVTCRLDNGNDTTYNYVSGEANDTINFTNGPVYLTLTSIDQTVTRTYSIEVNVHQVDPDVYTWTDFEQRSLTDAVNPSEIAQWGAVERGDSIFALYRLTSGKAKLLVGSGNGLDKWEAKETTLPQDADLSTFTAAEDAFYVVADGKLMSTLSFSNWTDTGSSMTYIYGAQGSTVLGVDLKDGKYYHVTYPASVTSEVDAKCPVRGTSQLFTYVTKWSDSPMSIFTGGETATGSNPTASWAFDGQKWRSITLESMPGRKDFMVVPYFTFKVSSQWIVSDKSVLYAFGGTTLDNETDTTVYVSADRGVHWTEGPEAMILPAEVGRLVDCRAFVVNRLNTDSRSVGSSWTGVKLPPLPRWAHVDKNYATSSRATTPITEWETPYIYIFDGANSKIWRGVINRLMFKPLQ